MKFSINVVDVLIHEGQHVEKGAPLVKINYSNSDALAN